MGHGCPRAAVSPGRSGRRVHRRCQSVSGREGARVRHRLQAPAADAWQSDCRFVRAYYYTALLDEQEYSPIRPLVDWLDYNGYTMVTKPLKEFTQSTGRRKFKGNMDVEITVDVMEMSRQRRSRRADLRRRRFPPAGRGGAAARRAGDRGQHHPHPAADGRRRAAAPGRLLPRPVRAAGQGRARVSGAS